MKSPRFWLIIWGSIGAIFLVYLAISSSLPQKNSWSQSGQTPVSQAAVGPFLVGDMTDFTPAFPPRRAPEIPFTHQGKEIYLKQFRDKVVLVNFWATWCAPCLKELPSLNNLQKQFDTNEFEIVAIAADPRGPKVAQDYLSKLNIDTLQLYADPRLLFASAIGGANVLPVSILYDTKGNEIGRLVGEAVWDSPEAINLIKAAVNKQKITR